MRMRTLITLEIRDGASKMATETVSHVWSFGIGSNMNVELVENKKKIKVLEHACAVLTGAYSCIFLFSV